MFRFIVLYATSAKSEWLLHATWKFVQRAAGECAITLFARVAYNIFCTIEQKNEKKTTINNSSVLCVVCEIVIYEPSAGRRCSRMSAFFKARATKKRVPLINGRMNGRCLYASGSYNIFCTLNINEHKTK
jgi:hypothetical protein